MTCSANWFWREVVLLRLPFGWCLCEQFDALALLTNQGACGTIQQSIFMKVMPLVFMSISLRSNSSCPQTGQIREMSPTRYRVVGVTSDLAAALRPAPILPNVFFMSISFSSRTDFIRMTSGSYIQWISFLKPIDKSFSWKGFIPVACVYQSFFEWHAKWCFHFWYTYVLEPISGCGGRWRGWGMEYPFSLMVERSGLFGWWWN